MILKNGYFDITASQATPSLQPLPFILVTPSKIGFSMFQMILIKKKCNGFFFISFFFLDIRFVDEPNQCPLNDII